MSTLGKILTVLVALVSVVVFTLVCNEIVLREKWRARYDDQAKQTDEALRERDSAFDQRNKVKGDWDADRALKEQMINTSKDQVELGKTTISTLTAEKENQEKRLAELVEKVSGVENSLKTLIAEKDSWRGERDKAMQEADQLRRMNAEQDAQLRTAQNDLANLKETTRQTAEKLAATESRLAWVKQNHPEVKVPDPIPAIPTETVRGLVTSVDGAAKVVQISLGSDSGIVKGMKFFVYNKDEMKYLATMIVSSVSNKSAAGELTAIRGTVKVNDHVTNRFE